MISQFKKHGYFEFLLKHEYKNHEPTFIYWKQSVDPTQTIKGQKEVGFVPLNVPSYNPQFKGLAKSSESFTYIDGTPGEGGQSNWWYAIGSHTYYPVQNTIPGPPIKDNDSYIGAIRVFLWVLTTKQTCLKSDHVMKHVFSLLSIFCFY